MTPEGCGTECQLPPTTISVYMRNMRFWRNRQESVMSSYFTSLFKFLLRTHSCMKEHVLQTNWKVTRAAPPTVPHAAARLEPCFLCSFLHSLIMKNQVGNIYWEERSGSKGSVKRKGAEGCWICPCLPAEALDRSHCGRICSSICPFLWFLHNIAAAQTFSFTSKASQDHISHKEQYWEDCCRRFEGLTLSPIDPALSLIWLQLYK